MWRRPVAGPYFYPHRLPPCSNCLPACLPARLLLPPSQFLSTGTIAALEEAEAEVKGPPGKDAQMALRMMM